MENTLLNMIPSSYIPEVHLSQYDEGRTIQFKLMDGNSEYTIPSGANIKILATKPSGLGFEAACTFSGNIVTLVNTETMSNEAGRFRAELRITSGNVILGTSNFIMNVERSPHPEGTIDGDAESLLPELTLLVERIEDSNARIESMTASATPLPSGQNPTATYNPTTNSLDLGIPVADRQYITVDGVQYPITSITKTVVDEVSGLLVAYGTDSTVFIPDGVGVKNVAQILQAQINGKVSAVKLNGDILTPHYDSAFGDGVVDLGTISDDTKADAIVKSASGSIASFSDGGDNLPMKSLKVNIVPKQSGNGDPSPSNVRPISGWDSVAVNQLKKNFLPKGETKTQLGVTFTVNDDGSISLSGTATSTANINVATNITLPQGSYKYCDFASGTFPSNTSARSQVYSGSAETNLATANNDPSTREYSGTLGKATNYVVRVRLVSGHNYNGCSIKPMLVASTDSIGSYEPYEEPAVITTNLPQTVYGGNVDIIEGKGQPTYHYFKPLGSESTLSDLGTFWGWVGDILQTPYGYGNDPQDGECSHFRFGTDCIVGLNASSGSYFLIYKTALPNISTLDEFKTWVANQRTNGTPLEVAYRLATPTASEFDTTPTEVKTKLGSNNIWSESGTVEVEYRADTTLAYNELLSLIANM